MSLNNMTKEDIIETYSYIEKINDASDQIFIISHGGNKGNDSSLIIGIADGLNKAGASVVTYNFSYFNKGIGNSRGLVDELNDLWNIYEFVSKEYPSKRINLVGKSLGGVASSWLPDKKGVNPESISLMGCVMGEGGVGFGNYSGPVVIVQGENDRYGNKESVERFMKDYPGKVVVKEISNADHSYRNTDKENGPENYEKEAIDSLIAGLKDLNIFG
ncbi:MAG: hypothetical protein KGL39_21890 [Patescibacteria group bacterium]|nr:hypothetical protein [Patescibacteria group bacterium]